MTEKEKMLLGHLYYVNDLEIDKDFKRSKRIIRQINKTSEKHGKYRVRLFRKLLKSTGKNLWIETPFQCDFGYNITVGENFFANYDCIILDSNEVIIGNNVFLGPRVSIYTVNHPIDPNVRNKSLEYAKGIKIGNNVWIGGNTVINPGVNIGDNVVIGSGSVVTKNIPSYVIAAGNPCHVIRHLTTEEHCFGE